MFDDLSDRVEIQYSELFALLDGFEGTRPAPVSAAKIDTITPPPDFFDNTPTVHSVQFQANLDAFDFDAEFGTKPVASSVSLTVPPSALPALRPPPLPRDTAKAARRMKAHAELAQKFSTYDCLVARDRSDALVIEEAIADNREVAQCSIPLISTVSARPLPEMGSTVRLSGLSRNDSVFNGMLATVLPPSTLSINSNCFRVRFHNLHRGRSLLIVRAVNMLPTSDEYSPPRLGIYTSTKNGVEFEDDDIGSRVVLVGLAKSSNFSHLEGHLGEVARQLGGKFEVKVLSMRTPIHITLPPDNLKLVDISPGAKEPNWAALGACSRRKAHLPKWMRDAASRDDQR